MSSLDNLPPELLIGRRVAFAQGSDHAGCWHARVGLKTGRVLRPALTLAQKAELLATEGFAPPEALTEEAEVPRLWVRADPCPGFRNGCEIAVEKHCLFLDDRAKAEE